MTGLSKPSVCAVRVAGGRGEGKTEEIMKKK
jgi:hypothetical protein